MLELSDELAGRTVKVQVDLSDVRPVETLKGFGGMVNPVKLKDLLRVARLLGKAVGRKLVSGVLPAD